MSSHGVFISARYSSYFSAHWLDWLSAQGFEHVVLDHNDKERNDQWLKRIVRSGRYDIILMTIGEVSFSLTGLRLLSTFTSIAFMTDDEWRFHTTTLPLSHYVDWIVTPYAPNLPHYREAGMENVVLSQYACNQRVFRPLGLPKIHDVAFIGLPHTDRVALADYLISNGIYLKVFGALWDRYPKFSPYWGGYLSVEGMIRVINQSKILLNPGGQVSGLQIKGRTFEIPGCGGFQLTDENPELERFYRPGEEIVTYRDYDELLEKVRYYLEHESERERIARAAYEATLARHTWDRQLDNIFRAVREHPQKRPQDGPGRVLILNTARGDGALAPLELPTGTEVVSLEEFDAAQTDLKSVVASRAGRGPLSVVFAEPGVAYDVDRVRLHTALLGPQNQGPWDVALAPFDVRDGAGFPYAHYRVGRQVERLARLPDPDALAAIPLSSIAFTSEAFLSLFADRSRVTADMVREELLRYAVLNGRSMAIEMDTGLFSYRDSSARNMVRRYREGADGSVWNVRTRQHIRSLLRRGALPNAALAAYGVMQRRKDRRRALQPAG